MKVFFAIVAVMAVLTVSVTANDKKKPKPPPARICEEADVRCRDDRKANQYCENNSWHDNQICGSGEYCVMDTFAFCVPCMTSKCPP